MAYYKIKSITNKLPKRHTFANAILDVSINTKFDKDVHKLRAGAEMVISADNLPLCVHKLRAQKLVEVIKVTEDTYKKQESAKANAATTVPAKPVPVITAPPFVEKDEEDDDDDDEKRNKRRPKKHL